jgi:hypothetical protein
MEFTLGTEAKILKKLKEYVSNREDGGSRPP